MKMTIDNATTRNIQGTKMQKIPRVGVITCPFDVT